MVREKKCVVCGNVFVLNKWNQTCCSDKCKKTRKKYTDKRYNQSEHGRETARTRMQIYNKSEHGHEMHKKYYRSEKGREVSKRGMKRYFQSKKGRETLKKAERNKRARKKRVEENFTAKQERFVRRFWNYRCAICNRQSDLFDFIYGKFPLDHWLPLSPKNGGIGYPLAIGNAVLMCPQCNNKKHNKLPGEAYNSKTQRRIELRLREQISEWHQLMVNNL